jgi:hypothetical protein
MGGFNELCVIHKGMTKSRAANVSGMINIFFQKPIVSINPLN